jgi:hypothetical protein
MKAGRQTMHVRRHLRRVGVVNWFLRRCDREGYPDLLTLKKNTAAAR